MSNVKIEKQNQTSQTGSPANVSGMMERSGQGGSIAQRGAWMPAPFSLSPREFFSASPFELMRRFTDEMDRAFENFGMRRSGSGMDSSFWSPAVEVFEREKHFVIRAELPGLNKEDVKVEVTDDGLILQGERKRENEEQGEGWYRSERSYGQFYRVIPLPKGADVDQAKAQFENGVLEIALPVPASQRRHRSIPINASSAESLPPQAKAASGANGK